MDSVGKDSVQKQFRLVYIGSIMLWIVSVGISFLLRMNRYQFVFDVVECLVIGIVFSQVRQLFLQITDSID